MIFRKNLDIANLHEAFYSPTVDIGSLRPRLRAYTCINEGINHRFQPMPSGVMSVPGPSGGLVPECDMKHSSNYVITVNTAT